MKRLICKIAVVKFIILLFFPCSAAFAAIGTVKVASGSAIVIRNGQVLAALPGLRIERSDILQTGKNGRMGITFVDLSRFSLGPNGRLSIVEYLYDSTTKRGRFLTKMDRGSLAAISGNIARSDRKAMQVRTPDTLLGVIGTRFLVVVK